MVKKTSNTEKVVHKDRELVRERGRVRQRERTIESGKEREREGTRELKRGEVDS